MKKKMMTTVALVLVCALFTLNACSQADAMTKEGTSARTDTEQTETGIADEETGEARDIVTESCRLYKEETVYCFASPTGEVGQIIVSDHLQNASAADRMYDVSILNDIENVKGDETYEKEAEDGLFWDAYGKDIYYQGETDKALPVSVNVTYTLDGVQMTPAEIEGKDGHITIRYDYQNLTPSQEGVYVPFAMLTVAILDDDVFSGTEMTNGRIVNDGSRTVAVGYAFPGLQEALGVSADQIEIPSYVEITADVRDFHMAGTMTVATNEIFEKIDTGKLDRLDEITEAVNEITDAMTQLIDGSGALCEGLVTLQTKISDLVGGVNQIAAGASQLSEGAASLATGTYDLQNGAGQLVTGLNTLTGNNAQLNSGARQVFDTLISTANAQLQGNAELKALLGDVPILTIYNYASVLDRIASGIGGAAYQTALAQVTEGVEEKRPYIEQQVKSAVEAQVTEQVTAAVEAEVKGKVTAAVREGIAAQVQPQVEAAVRDGVIAQILELTEQGIDTYDKYIAARSALEAAGVDVAAIDAAIDAQLASASTANMITSKVDEQMTSGSIQAAITQQTEAQMNGSEAQAAIAQNVAAQMASDTIQELIKNNTEAQVQLAISDEMNTNPAVKEAIAAAGEKAQSVVALKNSLDSYNAFYQGLLAYTAGVSQVAEGAASLKEGADKLRIGADTLASGSSTLSEGTTTLQNNMPALVSGVNELTEGARILHEGIETFNEEAIEQIVSLLEDDLRDLADNLRTVIDASKTYHSFAGKSEDADGSVRFLIRTGAIGE